MSQPGGAGAIFLLTDYGQLDELAGVVRAVLTRLAPGAPLVDLTHDIDPFDVRAGALALERAAPHLGPGVVLAVVDPEVGTGRRAVALQPDGDGPYALVGPDNGLLCRACDALGGTRAAVSLPPATGEGRVTFDGRDLFAPAAATLWRGEPMGSLGPELDPASLVRLPDPVVVAGPDELTAEVLWVDRFGNVQLSATADDGRRAGLTLGTEAELVAGPVSVRTVFVRAFDDVPAPESEATGVPAPESEATGVPVLGVIVDANGRLALVGARRSAAASLGVRAGDVVRLRTTPGGASEPSVSR